MTISMFKYTYRSELQGIPSKRDLHAIAKPDRNRILHNQSRTDDHSKPTWNQIDFMDSHGLCQPITNNFLSITPASWSFLLQKQNRKWCSPNNNDQHPSFITDRRSKIQNSLNPGWVEPDTNYIYYLVINWIFDLYKIFNINQSRSI